MKKRIGTLKDKILVQGGENPVNELKPNELLVKESDKGIDLINDKGESVVTEPEIPVYYPPDHNNARFIFSNGRLEKTSDPDYQGEKQGYIAFINGFAETCPTYESSHLRFQLCGLQNGYCVHSITVQGTSAPCTLEYYSVDGTKIVQDVQLEGNHMGGLATCLVFKTTADIMGNVYSGPFMYACEWLEICHPWELEEVFKKHDISLYKIIQHNFSK